MLENWDDMLDALEDVVPYNEKSLEQVSVCVFNKKVPVHALLQIIGDIQTKGLNQSTAKPLAAYAFSSHFEQQGIEKRLHKFIKTSVVSFDCNPLPAPSQDDGKWQIDRLLKHFNISTNESVAEQDITKKQLETTCSVAYFVLIKVLKLQKYDGDSNIFPNQTLFAVLVKTMTRFCSFDTLVSSYREVSSSLACAGAILSHHNIECMPLDEMMSMVFHDVTVDDFTALKFVYKVAKIDKITPNQLFNRFTTPQWKKFAKLFKERREDLEAIPSWYTISSLLLPNIRKDFSTVRNPVVAATCIKILNKFQPETRFSRVESPLFPWDVEEVEHAYREYMAQR